MKPFCQWLVTPSNRLDLCQSNPIETVGRFNIPSLFCSLFTRVSRPSRGGSAKGRANILPVPYGGSCRFDPRSDINAVVNSCAYVKAQYPHICGDTCDMDREMMHDIEIAATTGFHEKDIDNSAQRVDANRDKDEVEDAEEKKKRETYNPVCIFSSTETWNSKEAAVEDQCCQCPAGSSFLDVFVARMAQPEGVPEDAPPQTLPPHLLGAWGDPINLVAPSQGKTRVDKAPHKKAKRHGIGTDVTHAKVKPLKTDHLHPNKTLAHNPTTALKQNVASVPKKSECCPCTDQNNGLARVNSISSAEEKKNGKGAAATVAAANQPIPTWGNKNRERAVKGVNAEILRWAKKYGVDCGEEGSGYVSIGCLQKKEAQAAEPKDEIVPTVPPMIQEAIVTGIENVTAVTNKSSLNQLSPRIWEKEHQQNVTIESFQESSLNPDQKKNKLKRIEYRGEDEAA